jgi:F-type H+-transporting ATPase subunit b
MELLTQFGFDPVALGAQIFNFLIILFILRRFLYKPLLTVLKKRRDMIQEGIEKAEEATKRLEQVVEDEKQILKKAQTGAVKIIEESKDQARNIVAMAEESAQKQAEKIIKDAKSQIANDVKEAEKMLTKHVSTLAIKLLEEALGNMTNKKVQEEVMEQALKRMKGKAN